MTRSLREPNNMTELCGVMLSRLAWEMTRVQNELQSDLAGTLAATKINVKRSIGFSMT